VSPIIPEAKALADCEAQLAIFRRWCSQGEARNLRSRSVEGEAGEAFLLQGGDGRELGPSTRQNLRDFFRVLAAIGGGPDYAGARPGGESGPYSGQFAKPRSRADEKQNRRERRDSRATSSTTSHAHERVRSAPISSASDGVIGSTAGREPAPRLRHGGLQPRQVPA